MEPSTLMPTIAVLSLVSVEYGGWALLGCLNGFGRLGRFRERYFLAGYAHAGVLLVLTLVYFCTSTTKDNSRRAWSKTDWRWASGKRQIIEGVIYQLKDFFSTMERHRAKTLGGLLTCLAAKVAAYTCAQRLNDFLGRPLRNLVDLLV